MSNPQGGTGDAPGNEKPPPSGPYGSRQCPIAPKKPTEEFDDKPAHVTTEEWTAFNRVEEYKYTMAFDRFLFEFMFLNVVFKFIQKYLLMS